MAVQLGANSLLQLAENILIQLLLEKKVVLELFMLEVEDLYLKENILE